MKRGIATFTLDYGRCPPWLFERMVKLSREMMRRAVNRTKLPFTEKNSALKRLSDL